MITKDMKSLRDARHVEKYVYTLSDPLFYEPFETVYKPSDEFRTIVSNLLNDRREEGWIIARDGLWFHTFPRNFNWPVQGWKIHVSATLDNSTSLLKKVADTAVRNGVPFKFALDKNILGMMGVKRWRRGSSGKFITLYPIDVSVFTRLLEQLYQELAQEKGPYVLSDRRYKDCRVLYYRYGGMARTEQLEITGEKVLVLRTPTGEAQPDVRTPYFAPPPWVTDPFSAPRGERRSLTLRNGRYSITSALAFSNSGGVYLATDHDTGSEVIIKEARPFTVLDKYGNDAIKRLHKEHAILELLAGSGIAPKPIDCFQEWEHSFLVEEYLEGVDFRQFILTQNPLMKIRPSVADSADYFKVFKTVLSNFIKAIALLHSQGVIFGDLSPKNIKIDPATQAMRFIDFEAAMRRDVDDPTYLYTPGFKSVASIRDNAHTEKEDLYALAAIMSYMIFPIAAIAELRADLFDEILNTLIGDIGWSETNVAQVIKELSRNEITCERACELLDSQANVSQPEYSEDNVPEQCYDMIQLFGDFILAHMRPDKRGSLFPADPFMYQTNPLSLGFGACGILYVLRKCGFEIPTAAFDWLQRELQVVRRESIPPGLLTGSAGIAWCMYTLGLEEQAVQFINMANESVLLKHHHSYLYGMAGVGMANLFFYLCTRKPEYLSTANDLADWLLAGAKEDKRGIYWEAHNLVHLGYGYGQSGVALFLLRLHQLTQREDVLSLGKRALEFDLSYGIVSERGVLCFPHTTSEPTAIPYLEEGCAGIAKVAMRYGIWDRMDMMMSEVHRKYVSFPGLMFGLGSFIDVLTDAFIFSGNAHYLQMAKRPLAGLNDVYLLNRPEGMATPGDGLFRISCDYATGTAGVMRVLYRLAHHDESDFTLDTVSASTALNETLKSSGFQQCLV